MAENPFADIPGTTVFDATQSRMGYPLNQFCMSLMTAANREAFKADERAYLDRWGMSEAQKRAVLDRDWSALIALGGNVFFTGKLAATDGLSFQQVAAKMSGSTQEDYLQMMLNGGRSIEGNRSKKEQR